MISSFTLLTIKGTLTNSVKQQNVPMGVLLLAQQQQAVIDNAYNHDHYVTVLCHECHTINNRDKEQ